jgi:hypothetical protein
MNSIESKRVEYKPRNIRLLFVAEAPPSYPERFFYFEQVHTQDSLFLQMMRLLYEGYDVNPKAIRNNKKELLGRFKEDGYYLIDAVDTPIDGKDKINIIKHNISILIPKIKSLVSSDTKIILISSTVYAACYAELKLAELNVINQSSIPFPGSGQQKRFYQSLSDLLNKIGIKTKKQY